MTVRFTNRASALLVSPLPTGGHDAVVEAGKGDLYPDVSGGDFAVLMLTNLTGGSEIVHMTGKAGDHLTVVRAQEGTAEVPWDTGARIELRVTAGVLDTFLQTTGGVMTGAIDMDGHQILNASFPTGSLAFDTVVAQRFRGAATQATNQLVLPPNGEAPTVGGSMIVTAAMLSAAIFPWSGNPATGRTARRTCGTGSSSASAPSTPAARRAPPRTRRWRRTRAGSTTTAARRRPTSSCPTTCRPAITSTPYTAPDRSPPRT
jgi:hypothetical protein